MSGSVSDSAAQPESVSVATEANGPAKELFDTMVNGIDADVEDEEVKEVLCQDCQRDLPSASCQEIGNKKVGRKKLVYYRCNQCHAARARISRLVSRKGSLAADWAKVPDDQKKDFIMRASELKSEELEKGMAVFMSMQKENVESVNSSTAGEYYPLSVYAAKGYSEENLKGIEESAPKKFDAVLKDWTFQYMVDGSGAKTEENTKNITSYEPVGQPSRKRDSAALEDQSKNLKDSEKQKKKDEAEKKKAAEKQARADKAIAQKVAAIITPLITQGSGLLRHKARLPKIAAKLPAFVTDECIGCLDELELLDAVWKEVINGHPAPSQTCYQMEHVNGLKKKAAKMFENLAYMIKMADS